MSASKFDTAVDIVKRLPSDGPVKLSTDDKLKFYGLFKQANEGPVTTAKPTGMFAFEAKAKWEAWSKVKDLSQEQAKEEYVALLLEYLNKAEDDPEIKKFIDELQAA
ncbi:acyl-CoA-binding protein [Calocera cornea HHB12733]|uniref:Acyl-CoA-binding protein n=1 Tax=Calocera cornea HHB12733 TaxID=1353952 RepID=A0A165DJD7_9BASI|nr:acyl-CoA-binding protein [Calocera cornea HHB12733]